MYSCWDMIRLWHILVHWFLYTPFCIYIVNTHYSFHILNIDTLIKNLNIVREIIDGVYRLYINECETLFSAYLNWDKCVQSFCAVSEGNALITKHYSCHWKIVYTEKVCWQILYHLFFKRSYLKKKSSSNKTYNWNFDE